MLKWLVTKLFWYYQGKENWEMKMEQPSGIRDLTPEEYQRLKEAGRL